MIPATKGPTGSGSHQKLRQFFAKRTLEPTYIYGRAAIHKHPAQSQGNSRLRHVITFCYVYYFPSTLLDSRMPNSRAYRQLTCAIARAKQRNENSSVSPLAVMGVCNMRTRTTQIVGHPHQRTVKHAYQQSNTPTLKCVMRHAACACFL